MTTIEERLDQVIKECEKANTLISDVLLKYLMFIKTGEEIGS